MRNTNDTRGELPNTSLHHRWAKGFGKAKKRHPYTKLDFDPSQPFDFTSVPQYKS
jgi:hypothetical protein